MKWKQKRYERCLYILFLVEHILPIDVYMHCNVVMYYGTMGLLDVTHMCNVNDEVLV